MEKIIQTENGTISCHLDKNCRTCVRLCTMSLEDLVVLNGDKRAEYESLLGGVSFFPKEKKLYIWY